MRVMSWIVGVVLALCGGAMAWQGAAGVGRSPEAFAMRVVATGLEGPWEVAWGPDQHLWVTERTGGRVVRINPATGSKDVLVTVPEVAHVVTQDGLLGLALHPDLLRNAGADFVYVAFTYDTAPGADVAMRLAIRRYRHDAAARTLVDPTPILTGLPAHNDHVGGRLVIGTDRKLYMAIGDQGSNWMANRCRPIRAQDLPTDAEVGAKDWSAYAGKILRIDLDGTVPADNPVINGVRSHVFSYGHRNPLGLAVSPAGRVYESEHGPDTDDELNLILPGRNYGWPFVAGFKDDKAYVYANWAASAPQPCAAVSKETLPPASVPRFPEGKWNGPAFTPPLRTFFTWDTAETVPQTGGTIAPGGLGLHERGRGVPGWDDALLVLSMVRGVVYRVPLAPDGQSVREPPMEVFKTTNRYRDIAVHPDQRTFYLVTDPAGRTMDASGTPTSALANPGSVLEFRLQ